MLINVLTRFQASGFKLQVSSSRIILMLFYLKRETWNSILWIKHLLSI